MMFSKRLRFDKICEKARESHDLFAKELPGYNDHGVYRFTTESGTKVKIAVKVFNLN